MTFPQSLLAARKAAGLSQRAAADALRAHGVSVSERALAGYERGENAPDEIKQAATLAALGNLARQRQAEPRQSLADFDAEERGQLAAPVYILGRYCVLAFTDRAGNPVYGHTPGGEIVAAGSFVGVASSPVG